VPCQRRRCTVNLILLQKSLAVLYAALIGIGFDNNRYAELAMILLRTGKLKRRALLLFVILTDNRTVPPLK